MCEGSRAGRKAVPGPQLVLFGAWCLRNEGAAPLGKTPRYPVAHWTQPDFRLRIQTRFSLSMAKVKVCVDFGTSTQKLLLFPGSTCVQTGEKGCETLTSGFGNHLTPKGAQA